MTYDVTQLPITQTVAFTGRRPKDLLGYDHKAYQKLSQFLSDDLLEALYQNGARSFITGGAQGFDQLACWAVVELRKRHPDVLNIVYMPVSSQDALWKKYGAFSQTEFRKMLATADEIRIIDTSVTTSSPKADISRAMQARNAAMVDDSDILIALVPHDAVLPAGGTSSTIRYAKNHGKAVMRLEYELTTQVEPAAVVLDK